MSESRSGFAVGVVYFAGIMMIVVGALNMLQGLAAIIKNEFFVVSANYAYKLAAAEAEIDWARPCAEIERRLRALRPAPGARTQLRGEPVKLWRAICAPARGAPGTVLAADAAGVLVACGVGALRVSELQRAGGRRLAAAEFLRGCPIPAGECLGPAR